MTVGNSLKHRIYYNKWRKLKFGVIICLSEIAESVGQTIESTLDRYGIGSSSCQSSIEQNVRCSNRQLEVPIPNSRRPSGMNIFKLK